jgi:K+-sensing histidine kinase KdpD
MGHSNLRVACDLDCGHCVFVVGKTRTTERNTPPSIFYLLPTALVAVLYGVAEGALFAVAAFLCSAFLLYDPIYSFYVSSMHALGELFWFLIVALVGVKCVAELRRRSEKT